MPNDQQTPAPETHVTYTSHADGTAVIKINGVDISRAVMASDFHIELRHRLIPPRPPLIHLTVRPDMLTVDGLVALDVVTKAVTP